MSTEKQPSSHRLSGERYKMQNRVASNTPPYDAKLGEISQRVYPHTVPPPSAWQHMYALARKPWIFVPAIGSYWIISIMQLVAKISTFNIASVLISSFALVLAVMHNVVEVLDCLGTIFRQTGAGLRATGEAFNLIGHVLRRIARRLKEALS